MVGPIACERSANKKHRANHRAACAAVVGGVLIGWEGQWCCGRQGERLCLVDVADATDSIVTRIDTVLVLDKVELFWCTCPSLGTDSSIPFLPGHATIQPNVDVAHIEGPIGGIVSCQQLGCGGPGAGGLDESREIQMLGITLLWWGAWVRAMRCLADTLDIVGSVLAWSRPQSPGSRQVWFAPVHWSRRCLRPSPSG